MNDQQKAALKVSIRLSEGSCTATPSPEAVEEAAAAPTLKESFAPAKPLDGAARSSTEEKTSDGAATPPAEGEPPASEAPFPLEAEEPALPPEPPVVPAPFGQPYETVGALGDEMLERIRRSRTSDLTKLDALLRERQISDYLSRVEPVDYALQEAVFAVETAHLIGESAKAERLLHFYTVAFLIADHKQFVTDGRVIADVDGLSAYMKSLLDASYRDLERFCHRMVSYDGVLDPQLEAWLTVLGKADLLDEWRRKIRE